MNLVRYWSRASWVTICETYVKDFLKSVQKHCLEKDKFTNKSFKKVEI